MDDQQTEVMPCPFCGAHDVAVTEGETFRWRLVICNCCGARGPDVRIQTAGSGTKEDWERNAYAGAMAEWNKRMHLRHKDMTLGVATCWKRSDRGNTTKATCATC